MLTSHRDVNCRRTEYVQPSKFESRSENELFLRGNPGSGWSSERNTDQLFAIMDVKASIREGRRAPCYVAATAVFTGFQQLRATDLGKPFRRQSPGNEFALVVPNEHTVFVLNEKG